ncbi:MAG: hypothetical protein E7011_02180 [Alphaproteobacteria bacterium]|nr:hypothetical protein [Alphaproteobacteria bacterium]
MNNELGDRSQYIGGSDIAAILGISPWKTRNALLREKITQEHRNFSTAATRFGHDNESTLINFDALTVGYETDAETPVIENPKFGPLSFDFPMILHLDGMGTMPDGERILIECKTSGTAFNGTLPEYYKPQVQTYLAALENQGVHRARIVFGLRSEDKIGETEGFWVEADKDYFQNTIVPAVASFCLEVNAGRQRIAAGESIDDILPVTTADAVAIMGDTAIQNVSNALDMIEHYNSIVDEFKKTLKEKMETAGITSARFGNYVASITAATVRKTLDTAAIKRDYPGTFDRYTKETKVASSLRITKKK